LVGPGFKDPLLEAIFPKAWIRKLGLYKIEYNFLNFLRKRINIGSCEHVSLLLAHFFNGC
jgi:hypothetical protein